MSLDVPHQSESVSELVYIMDNRISGRQSPVVDTTAVRKTLFMSPSSDVDTTSSGLMSSFISTIIEDIFVCD